MCSTVVSMVRVLASIAQVKHRPLTEEQEEQGQSGQSDWGTPSGAAEELRPDQQTAATQPGT